MTAQLDETVPTSYHSATFALLQKITLEYIPTNLKSWGDELLVCSRSGSDHYCIVRIHSKEMGNLKVQTTQLIAHENSQNLTNVKSVHDILPYMYYNNQYYLAAAEGGFFDFGSGFGKFVIYKQTLFSE